uniref:Uncharacterized protein n=1 Tax=Physcomitrium patens TaxID=3218 RepID=A0A2K1KJY3_PHYPA|nr:hypothetical protein PHYPA_007758 [Physcomitrium patens]
MLHRNFMDRSWKEVDHVPPWMQMSLV